MAMNKARRTANLNNILTYDTLGNSTLIANLTVEGLTGAGFVKADVSGLLSVDTAAYTVVTGATNYLTKITAPNTLGQSLVYDNGTSVLVNSIVGVPGYSHAFQVVANLAGGLVVSTTDTASAIGIVNSASSNKTWDISPFGNHLVINESGVATRMKFDAGGNITIGDITNTGHKLEIVGSFRTTGNNTLSQLSGVGTRMVVVDTNGLLSTQAIATGSVTGTGAAGQVTFWTGTSAIGSNANFVWNNTNGRLGINTNNPLAPLHVATITTIGAVITGTQDNEVQITTTGTNNAALASLSSGDGTTSGRFAYFMLRSLETSPQRYDIGLRGNKNLVFFDQTANAARLAVFPTTGNIAINSTTDGGQRLQVQGATLLNGYTTVNGDIEIDNAFRRIFAGAAKSSVTRTSSGTSTIFYNAIQLAANNAAWSFMSDQTYTLTLGDINGIYVRNSFAPTSGTATFTHLLLDTRVNQTGGANGITRGLYVNPALTSAADFRAIETSAGNVLFGSNFFWDNTNGRLGIGTATPSGIWSGNNRSIQITAPANFASELVLSRPAGAFGAASVTHFLSGTGVDLFGVYTASTTSNYAVYTNSIERLRIWTTGNVSIGAGNNPSDTGELLQVSGTMKVTGTSNFGSNLIVSLNQNAGTFLTVRNQTNGTAASPILNIAGFNGNFQLSKTSPSYTGYKMLAAMDAAIYNDANGDIGILNDNASGAIKFAAGGASTAQMTLTSAGNLGIGTNAPSYALHVNRNVNGGEYLYITNSNTGTGAIAGTFINTNAGALTTQAFGSGYTPDPVNNIYPSSVRFRSSNGMTNGMYFFTGGTAPLYFGTADVPRLQVNGATGNVLIQNGGTFTDSGERLQVTGTAKITGATTIIGDTNIQGVLSFGTDIARASVLAGSGNNRGIIIQDNAGGTNGVVTLTVGNSTVQNSDKVDLALTNNYNTSLSYTKFLLTGTFTEAVGGGATRAIYINTTIGATTNYRAIEWTNNNGWGLYGVGTANNYLAGRLGVGTTSVTSRLTVGGSIELQGGGGVIQTSNTTTLYAGCVDTAGNPVGGYMTFLGNNFSAVNDRGGVEVVFDRRNTGAGGFNIFGFDGTNLVRFFKVSREGNLMLQNGGTYTDDANRLQVVGNSKLLGNVLVNTGTAIAGYGHALQVLANASGGMIVSATDTASAIGIVNSASANKTWDISPFGNDLVINESGVATRMKFKAAGNIEIPVLAGTGTRMVVADTNGTLSTQSLSTGAIGQVAFWTGASTQSGSNNLFWDSSTNRLGVGTNVPADPIHVEGSSGGGVYVRVRNTNAGTGSNGGINLINDASKTGGLYLFSSTYTPNSVLRPNTLSLYSGPDTNISVAVNNSTGHFSIGTGSGAFTEKVRVFTSGHMMLRGDGGAFTEDAGSRLHVVGNIKSTGIIRADSSRTATTNDVSIALLGSNFTTYPANFSMGAAGYGLNAIYGQHDQLFGGDAVFSSANLNGGGLILNRLQASATGTVTMQQIPTTGTVTGIRTMSNLHLMTQFSGNNNLTVTHMSGLHIFGHYRTGGTGTISVGTYYGVFVADPNEFGTGATVTGDNWGFYQQGAAPTNYFGGRVFIGTTTAGGSKFRISGIPTSATGLSVGDVWNDAGTLKIVI